MTATSRLLSACGPVLLWSDEFDGAADTGVNTSIWEQQVGAPTNNGRVEYCTDGTLNMAHDGNSNLVIECRREDYEGRSYTSARIESLAPYVFTTGYIEFRAKVPTWQGTMPGLWTYGAAGYGSVTGCSEIDVVEIQTGSALDPTCVRQTIHGELPNDLIWQLGWSSNKIDFTPGLPGDEWHTFGAYVDPTDGSVTFYADRVAVSRHEPGDQSTGGGWPYGVHAQKVIIEIEMGGYSGTPTTDVDSDTLTVDYVRVYDRPPY